MRVLLFCLLAIGCSTSPPNPSPALPSLPAPDAEPAQLTTESAESTDAGIDAMSPLVVMTGECLAACSNMSELGCKEAADIEECALKCVYYRVSAPGSIDIDCMQNASSVPAIRKCPRITCPCLRCMYI